MQAKWPNSPSVANWQSDGCKQDKANHVPAQVRSADFFLGQKHKHFLFPNMCMFDSLNTREKKKRSGLRLDEEVWFPQDTDTLLLFATKAKLQSI